MITFRNRWARVAVLAFSVLFPPSSFLEINAQRYVGGDISLLPQYEKYEVPYYDADSKKIDDVLQYLKSEAVGWNALRVRLFVNPTPSLDNNDPAICQDLDYVISLGKRIKEAGFAFMLDFHYSDVWADPSKQWTPVEWQSLNDEQLQSKLYEYTKDCLTKLVEAGAAPDFIQTGNEISYGMLWGKKGTNDNRCYGDSPVANWNRFIALLKQATKACREVCPDAKVIIHTERTGTPESVMDFCKRIADVDYDIVGLSYYPFWHKNLETLSTTLNLLADNYPEKPVQIVETAYYYQWKPSTGLNWNSFTTWPDTPEGQLAFVRDLIAELKNHPNVNGLYWWFPEENGNGPNKSILNGWLNRGLWDNDSHRALPALYELKAFADDPSAIVPFLNDRVGERDDWYTLQGLRLPSKPSRPGLYINGGRKVLLR
ncbi:MAG: glycosyl hydrolase 53 family protein [Prevotella sp.]|nr:glycosyl hydrolase 53 family protein [Prevotella sp.]